MQVVLLCLQVSYQAPIVCKSGSLTGLAAITFTILLSVYLWENANMAFIIECDHSGRLLQKFSGSAECFVPLLQDSTTQEVDDLSEFEGDGYVANGKFVLFPEKPSPHHEWDWTTKAWLPNLAAARESQRQAWNAWRDRELVAGYPHNGHIFHSDDRFMAELQLILKGYERGHLTGTSAIRTRDNAVLQMSAAEIESLLLLIGLHRQSIYQQSWVGKDALASLTTLEDIMAGGPPS